MTRPFHLRSPAPLTGADSAARMATALRTLALQVGGPSFAGLSTGTCRRLSFACNGFAELIQAGEDVPDTGMSLRSGACFLLSALAALGAAGGGALSTPDQTWLIAEVEHELGQATALFETRAGRPRSPAPPRPAQGASWTS